MFYDPQRAIFQLNGGRKIYFQHFIQQNSWIPLSSTVSSNENIEAGSFVVGEQTFN
jgi:hypothetical protein